MTDDDFFAANPSRNYRVRATGPDEADAARELPPGLAWIVIVRRALPGGFIRRLVCLPETNDLSEEACEHLFLTEGSDSLIALLTKDFHNA
jgi:hypothetical protein